MKNRDPLPEPKTGIKRRTILGAAALAVAAPAIYFLGKPLWRGEETTESNGNSSPPAENQATAASGAGNGAAPAASGTQTAETPGSEEGSILKEGDHVLGDPAAKITIIEYASLTCPHCANFHLTTFPMIKENWIDTGKVKIVYRHFPLDGVALRAALAADCLGDDKAFFAFIGLLYKQQEQWIKNPDPLAQIQKLAQFAGLPKEQFDTCIANEEAMNAVLAQRLEATNAHDINSTPTFIIGKEKISGDSPYPEFEKILNRLSQE